MGSVLLGFSIWGIIIYPRISDEFKEFDIYHNYLFIRVIFSFIGLAIAIGGFLLFKKEARDSKLSDNFEF